MDIFHSPDIINLSAVMDVADVAPSAIGSAANRIHPLLYGVFFLYILSNVSIRESRSPDVVAQLWIFSIISLCCRLFLCR